MINEIKKLLKELYDTEKIEKLSRVRGQILYHGTDTQFDAFDDSTRGSFGFYFAFTKEDAEEHARRRRGNVVVVEVRLSIKNPAPDAIVREVYDKSSGGNPRRQAHEYLARMGYDSIIRPKEVIVFNPQQIEIVNNIRENFFMTIGMSKSDPNVVRDVDIYSNPTRSDLFAIKREENSYYIRFIVDIEKNSILIWNAASSTHAYVIRRLRQQKILSANLVSGNLCFDGTNPHMIFDLNSNHGKSKEEIFSTVKQTNLFELTGLDADNLKTYSDMHSMQIVRGESRY